MSRTIAPLAIAISRGLRGRARAVAQEGHGRWRMAPVRGGKIPIDGRLDGAWCVLQAPLQHNGSDPFWAVIAAAADFPPLTKPVLEARCGLLSVRAEFPVGRGIDVERRAGEACAGIEKVLTRGRRRVKRKKARAECPPPAAAGLDALLSDAGWSSARGDDGTLTVGLETSRGAWRAGIVDLGMDGVNIAAPLSSGTELDVVRRQALGLFLLSAAGAVRLVRAAVDEGPRGLVMPRFEVRLPVAPAATEIDHALAALAAACEYCGPEARSLFGKDLAEQYLLARGAAPFRRQTVEAARAS